MPQIGFEKTLDMIRQRSDMVAIVSQHVNLKKVGKNYVGICPFHSDSDPSFQVNPDRKLYNCFGCRESGDLFNFVMLIEGKTFKEAVSTLGNLCGVEVKWSSSSKYDSKNQEKKKQLFDINKLSAEFYSNKYFKSDINGTARQYLEKIRGFSTAVIKKNVIGWAEDGWDHLYNYLKSKGVNLEFAAELGLIKKKSGSGYYDIFRDRIIFPIIQPGGNIIGFGARRLTEDKKIAKYLNSSASNIYDKSSSLYALNVATTEIRKNKGAIIVEGYTDVLALQQAGIVNVIAACGTALTSEHLNKLKRLTDNIYLVFDSDAAGLDAAFRCAQLVVQTDVIAKSVLLSTGDDPDTFIKKNSKETFLELIDNAPSLVEFVIFQARKRCGDSIEERINGLSILKPIVNAIKDSIIKSHYIKHIADLFKIEEIELRRIFVIKTGSQIQTTNQQNLNNDPFKNFRSEETIISLILKYNELVNSDLIHLDLFKLFRNSQLKKIGEDFISNFRENNYLSISNFLNNLNPNIRSRLYSRIMDESLSGNGYDLLKNSIEIFKTNSAKIIRKELINKMNFAKQQGNEKELQYLVEEYAALK